MSTIFTAEAPLGGFHISANVPRQHVPMSLSPQPTRRAARPLVGWNHFKVSGEQMTTCFQSARDKGFGQQGRSDLSIHECPVSAFPPADLDHPVIVSRHASGKKHPFEHQCKTAVLAVDADRFSAQ